MEKALITKLKNSLDNMRAKVIQAKGEAVKGLSELQEKTDKTLATPTKTREANA